MTTNMGSLDRGLRTVVALVLFALFFMGTVSGPLGWAALIVGVIMLGTAAIGWCPPYTILGINTCATKSVE